MIIFHESTRFLKNKIYRILSRFHRLEAELGHRGGRVLAVKAEDDVARQVVGRAVATGAARHAERGGRAGRARVQRTRSALGYYQLHSAERHGGGHHCATHVAQDGRARRGDGGRIAAVRGIVAQAERRGPHGHGGRRQGGGRVDLVYEGAHVDEVGRISRHLAGRVTDGGHLYTCLLENNSGSELLAG